MNDMLARMDDATTRADARTAKRMLRQQVREVWAACDLAAVGAAVTELLLALPELRDARTVAAYADLPGEVPTGPLVAALHARGVRVLLPVLADDDALGWRVAHPGGATRPGRRGTIEPDGTAPAAELREADVVVVPGLAYDGAGRRLGRGGGSYDRALADAAPHALVVGVGPDGVVVDEVPVEPHDRPVDVVVTPGGVRRVSRAGC